MGTSDARRKKLDRDELARRLAEVSLLRGDFTLRSGATSDRYFDKYRFEADPVLLAGVARLLAPMVPEEIEVLAGLELGGVPVATALAFATGLPMAFVRKEAKTYGTERLAEGSDIDGKHVLVVEDVVSSGGQIILSTNDLRERGAIVDHAICVVDRGGADALAAEHIKLHSLYALSELMPSAGGTSDADEPAKTPRGVDDAADRPADRPPHEHPPSAGAAPTPPEPPAATPLPGRGAEDAAPGGPLLPKRSSHARTDRKVAPPLMPGRSDPPA